MNPATPTSSTIFLTPPQAIRFVVRGLSSFALTPLPWQARSNGERAFLPEHMLWYLLIVSLPVGFVAGWRRDPTLTSMIRRIRHSHRGGARAYQRQRGHVTSAARANHALHRLGRCARALRDRRHDCASRSIARTAIDHGAGVSVVDSQGRLFGRINLIDAAVLVLLVLLLPLAYAASLMFQPRHARASTRSGASTLRTPNAGSLRAAACCRRSSRFAARDSIRCCAPISMIHRRLRSCSRTRTPPTCWSGRWARFPTT